MSRIEHSVLPRVYDALQARHAVVRDVLEVAAEKWREGYRIHWMRPRLVGDLFDTMSEEETAMWQEIRAIATRENEKLNRLSWCVRPRCA